MKKQIKACKLIFMNKSNSDKKVDVFLHIESPTSKPSNAETPCPQGISNLINLKDFINFMQISNRGRKFLKSPKLCIDGGCIVFYALPYASYITKNKKTIDNFSIKDFNFFKEIMTIVVKILKINNKKDFDRVVKVLSRILRPDNTIIGIEMRDAGSLYGLKRRK